MCLTVRHAIMQVNYRVRIRAVSEGDIDAVTIPAASGAGFRWARRRNGADRLTRKVLGRLHLMTPSRRTPHPFRSFL